MASHQWFSQCVEHIHSPALSSKMSKQCESIMYRFSSLHKLHCIRELIWLGVSWKMLGTHRQFARITVLPDSHEQKTESIVFTLFNFPELNEGDSKSLVSFQPSSSLKPKRPRSIPLPSGSSNNYNHEIIHLNS